MDDDVHLLCGFGGRIARRRYWAGWGYVVALSLGLGMISLVVAHATGIMLSGMREFPMSLLAFVMKTVVLLPLAAVTVKRLHDRNKSGYHAILAVGLLWLNDLAEFAGITDITGSPSAAGRLELLFSLAALAAFLWYTVELGFLRGTRGRNAYGPDPLAGAGTAGEASPS